MPITNESKEALKTSVDIVDVIDDYLELKKKGANFWACCPFHGEKTPSMSVSPSKQIYHCFGCGAGGDVFKFVMEYEKLEFIEAVEKVADRHNFVLQYTADHGERKDYGRVMDAVNDYYVKQLRDEDRRYLVKRGLSAATMKEWGIGYAPRTQAQIKALDGLLLPQDELIDVGVVALDGDRKYARFSDRVMFPIYLHTGKLVGWSGRALSDNAKAKYLNSPQTKLFDKSRILFGFDKAKEHIYSKDFAIIMEGQLDVILSHQIGIQTAVATQGTALTDQHLPMLKKTGAKIILAYDGDKAGRAAAYKAAYLLSTHGFAGGVVLFPDGEDPAAMIADGREEDVKKILRGWTVLPKFVLQTIVSGYKLDDPYAKSEALKMATGYLNALGNDIVAQEYTGYLSSLLGVDRTHIQLGSTAPPPQAIAVSSKASSEDLLLYTMYRQPGLIDEAVNVCDTEAWDDESSYAALLQSRADDMILAPVLLKDGLVELNETQFLAVLKVKQKQHLQTLKTRLQNEDAGLDEIMAVNERMKGL